MGITLQKMLDTIQEWLKQRDQVPKRFDLATQFPMCITPPNDPAREGPVQY